MPADISSPHRVPQAPPSGNLPLRALGRVLESSPLPLTLASPVFEDCPLIFANAAFLALTGYQRDDVVGRNCRLLQGPRTEPDARAALRSAVEARREATQLISNYRRDGSLFQNLVFLLPVFEASGRLLYVIGSQCDVTSPGRVVPPLAHARLLEETVAQDAGSLGLEDGLWLAANPSFSRAVRALGDSALPPRA